LWGTSPSFAGRFAPALPISRLPVDEAHCPCMIAGRFAPAPPIRGTLPVPLKPLRQMSQYQKNVSGSCLADKRRVSTYQRQVYQALYKINAIVSCLAEEIRVSAHQRHAPQTLNRNQHQFGVQGQRPGAGVQGAGGGPLQSTPDTGHAGRCILSQFICAF